MNETIQESKTEARLEEILTLINALPLEDRVKLIERIAAGVTYDLTGKETTAQKVKPTKSLLGLLADLGPAPTAEDIDEVRREMWGGYMEAPEASPNPKKSLLGMWSHLPPITEEDIDEARHEAWANFPRDDI